MSRRAVPFTMTRGEFLIDTPDNRSGSIESTVTFSDVPAGFRVRRLRAADFENQDPVTNDGRTLSTLSVTLRDRDGLLLVVEPLP